MRDIPTGEDKIQQICTKLKEETLLPAKEEANRIIAEARAKADGIIQEAHKEAESIITEGRGRIDQERSVFESNLSQAAKQSMQALRQEIETKLFNDELSKMIEQGAGNSGVAAQLVAAIVNAIEKQGIGVDLEAIIPEKVPAQAVTEALGQQMASRLREGIGLGNFAGGAQVKIHDSRMTIDISDRALNELLASYVRKDFREKLFADQQA